MFDQKIRAELDRIQNGEKMSDEAWEQAKQPVRTVGMGLQDIRLTVGGNYASAQGAVCRLHSEIKEKFTPDGRMGSVERVAQQLLVDRELKKIVEELRLREDSEDAENPICPPIEELKKFPAQREVANQLYEKKAKKLIEESGDCLLYTSDAADE